MTSELPITLSLSILCLALLATSAGAEVRLGPDPAAAFALADANHDGVVTRAEFRASREARFQALDRNHDGVLTLDDLPMVSGFRPGAARLEHQLMSFDLDGDGKVSLAEFIDGSMRLFDRLDATHKGFVTLAQFEHAVRAQMTSAASR